MRIGDWNSDVYSSDLICHCKRGSLCASISSAAVSWGPVQPWRWPKPVTALRSLTTIRAVTRPHRSDEPRVGKECVRTCQSLWYPSHLNKHTIQKQHKDYTNRSIPTIK